MPYPAIQSMFDGLYPPGDQWYWKGDFVHEVTDAAIAEHERYGEVPHSQSGMHLYPIDGASHDMDADATAWNYRDATWSMVIFGMDPDPANAQAIQDRAPTTGRPSTRSEPSAYVNFMMEEGQDRIQATYGDNHGAVTARQSRVRPGEPLPREPEHPPAT